MAGDGWEGAKVELLNQLIRFRVRDIYFPDPLIVLNALYADSVLEGRVLDVTEDDEGTKFAVVEVNRMQSPVLIALKRITER